MRFPLAAVVIATGAVLSAQTPPQTPPRTPPTFRTTTRTVVVYPSVHDAEGRIVPDLTKDDFTVLDNGKPAPITVFSSDIQPITVAVLLDMSGSMIPRYVKVREGTLSFIDALLPADRVRIGSFGAEVALSPILTGDKTLLSQIVREELWPGGGTPMWNAVHAAERSLISESGRRVVLVITDGYDTGGLPGLNGNYGDVTFEASRHDFMFYAIGMASLMPLQGDILGLVEDSGGGHFMVGDTDDLKETFARVAEELRRQYSIGFTPLVSDGKEHKLEIKAKPGMKVRARKSFVAEK